MSAENKPGRKRSKDKPDTQEEAVKQGYVHATRVLREKYAAEHRTLQTEFVRDNGYPDWSPPKTAAEKAKDALEALIKEHPELEDDLRLKYGLDGGEAFPAEDPDRTADLAGEKV